MDIFYFVLFAAVGLFNVLAGALDFKWYVDYWTHNPLVQQDDRARKKRRKCRALLIAAGIALIVYGVIMYTDLLSSLR